MPDCHYGEAIPQAAGLAAARLLLDDYNASAKAFAAAGLVQYGIDMGGIIAGGGNWLANGGWQNGRKLVLALSALVPPALAGTSAADRASIIRGAQWLIHRTQGGREFPPTPIGFYFAKLWYWENLYPVVWAVAALRAVEQWQQEK
jgi:hypothetical protein